MKFEKNGELWKFKICDEYYEKYVFDGNKRQNLRNLSFLVIPNQFF